VGSWQSVRALEFDPLRWMPGGDAKEHMENDSFWAIRRRPSKLHKLGFAMMEVSLVSFTELFMLSTRSFIQAFTVCYTI
jgi:hypothetical protein